MPKNILKKYNFFPKKRLGQNFLISEKVLKKIIFAAQLKKNDIILEIGAGTGVLTKELAKNVKQVIAVEKDKKLVAILKKELAQERIKNVEIIQGDILKIQNSFKIQNSKATLQGVPNFVRSSKIKNYKVVANLPYYITAPVIKMFLESESPPELMVLMVQKEVGERICAKPPKMSKLAVFCQFYSQPEIISFVSKKCFWPEPKVDSVILKFIPGISQELDRNRFFEKHENRALFSKIVNKGFSHPRKQLINNLSKELNITREKTENWLSKNKIKPTQRAETLAIKNWIDLTKTFDI